MKENNNFSIYAKELQDFAALLEEHIERSGKPSLAILFVNADLDFKGINELLNKEQIPHIGTSSAGELCNESFSTGVYSGLFLYLPEESFKIYHSAESESGLSGKELGLFAKEAFDKPGIYMLLASKNTQTDQFIEEVQQQNLSLIHI